MKTYTVETFHDARGPFLAVMCQNGTMVAKFETWERDQAIILADSLRIANS